MNPDEYFATMLHGSSSSISLLLGTERLRMSQTRRTHRRDASD
jgi:hypothetical protein